MTVKTVPAIERIEGAARFLFQPAIVLFILGMVLGRSVDSDTWWHLSDGRWMVQHGQILAADPFSYTRLGAIWSHPGYPYEVALYFVYQWLGYLGVDLLAAALLSAVFLVEWNALKTGPVRRFLLVGASILLSIAYWSARPNIFTLLFAVLFLLVLEKYRKGNRRVIWALPVLMLLWANLHGGFLAGFLLVSIYGVDDWLCDFQAGHFHSLSDLKYFRGLKTIGGVLLLMALATLVNPYGINQYREILLTAGRTAEQTMIQEWLSPDFHSLYGQFFLLAIAASLFIVGMARKPVRVSSLLLLIVFTSMALVSRRHLGLFAVVAPFAWLPLLGWEESTPVLNDGERRSHEPKRNPVMTGLSLAFLMYCLAVLALVVPVAAARPVNLAHFPARAVNYLKGAQPPGRLFNNFNWGGYLTWTLPEYPVFVDGRSDIYGDEIILQSDRVERAAPGWQAIIVQWDIHTILANAGSPLGEALTREGWQLCYSDEQAEVYQDGGPCERAK
jgi:hypothetical protein